MSTRLETLHEKAQHAYQKQRGNHRASRVAWQKLHALTLRILKRDLRKRLP